MRSALVLLLSAAALILLPADDAVAACHWATTTQVIDGHVQSQTVQVCTETTEVEDTGTEGIPLPTDSGLDSICVATAITLGEDPFAFCDESSTETPVEITSTLVAIAFSRIPLPAAELRIQPANGRTLVNFDTNFYTDTGALDRTVRLLGQRVDFHIVPSEFGWRFGDGESLVTSEPGAPYPDLLVTHRYLKKGMVAPSVDTTYTATYQVNGGPSIDVEGQVTIPGAPVDLEVLTATPTLVGYDRG